MRIVRDILDKKLIDVDGCEIGRVDGVVLQLPEGAPPRLVRLEMGGEILAERVGQWLIRPVRWIAERFGPRRAAIISIDWKHVTRMGRDLHVDIRADDTEALAWEHWLAEKFIGRIPGGS
jgi:sporulation protein YlmC with PRC-barrel domain